MVVVLLVSNINEHKAVLRNSTRFTSWEANSMCLLRLTKHTMLWRISDFCGQRDLERKTAAKEERKKSPIETAFKGLPRAIGKRTRAIIMLRPVALINRKNK